MSGDVVRRALEAVGAPEAGAESLPELISEMRFIGTTYVYRGEYPRNGGSKEKKMVKGRRKGIGYLGNIG